MLLRPVYLAQSATAFSTSNAYSPTRSSLDRQKGRRESVPPYRRHAIFSTSYSPTLVPLSAAPTLLTLFYLSYPPRSGRSLPPLPNHKTLLLTITTGKHGNVRYIPQYRRHRRARGRGACHSRGRHMPRGRRRNGSVAPSLHRLSAEKGEEVCPENPFALPLHPTNHPRFPSPIFRQSPRSQAPPFPCTDRKADDGDGGGDG